VFSTLSATSKRLWEVLCVRSWITRVLPRTNNFRAMARILIQVEIPVYTLFIESVSFSTAVACLWWHRPLTSSFLTTCRISIINLPRNSMGLLRDCLMGLPSLNMLGIVNSDGNTQPGAFKCLSRSKLDFPGITKVAIPVFAYPILALLPKVEEVICFSGSGERGTVAPVLRRLRKPYIKEREGQIEPDLKSITVVSPVRDWGCVDGVYNLSLSPFLPYPPVRVAIIKKFPRLRKLCLPEVGSPHRSPFPSLPPLTCGSSPAHRI
jgi:hypothetical protein